MGAGTALMQLDGKAAVHQLQHITYSLVTLLFNLGLVFIIQQKNVRQSVTPNAAAWLCWAQSCPLHTGETSGGGSAAPAPPATPNSPVR